MSIDTFKATCCGTVYAGPDGVEGLKAHRKATHSDSKDRRTYKGRLWSPDPLSNDRPYSHKAPAQPKGWAENLRRLVAENSNDVTWEDATEDTGQSWQPGTLYTNALGHPSATVATEPPWHLVPRNLHPLVRATIDRREVWAVRIDALGMATGVELLDMFPAPRNAAMWRRSGKTWTCARAYVDGEAVASSAAIMTRKAKAVFGKDAHRTTLQDSV